MNSILSAENFVLLLLNSNDKKSIAGKLCFQKEMFLIVKEICPNLDIELKFQPYHYGPYSKNLADLLNNLSKNSLINIDESSDTCTYSITEKGVKKISEVNIPWEILEKIKNLKINSNKLGYKGLIRYVYFNYPEYAENSRIKNRVFGDNQ